MKTNLKFHNPMPRHVNSKGFQYKYLLFLMIFFMYSFTFGLNSSHKVRIDSIQIYTCLHANQESRLHWSCFLNIDSMVYGSDERVAVVIKDTNVLDSIAQILTSNAEVKRILLYIDTGQIDTTRGQYFNVLFRVFINDEYYDFTSIHRYNTYLCEICNFNHTGHVFLNYKYKRYKFENNKLDYLYKVLFSKFIHRGPGTYGSHKH